MGLCLSTYIHVEVLICHLCILVRMQANVAVYIYLQSSHSNGGFVIISECSGRKSGMIALFCLVLIRLFYCLFLLICFGWFGNLI